MRLHRGTQMSAPRCCHTCRGVSGIQARAIGDADVCFPQFWLTFHDQPVDESRYGVKEKKAVAEARADVAALIDAKTEEVIFTSGGTESVNWAIRGVAEAHGHRGKHIVTSVVEHVVVLECCKYLERAGFEVTYVGVDSWGRVSADDVAKAIRKDTILVTIMHANNETGSINPIKDIAAIARAHGALMHTDASQSIGKIPVQVDALGVDLLTIAGHKLYAPAGIGALYVRSGATLGKFMLGAGHEDGRRAGTENVVFMVGLGKACALCRRLLAEGGGGPLPSLRERRDALHTLLLEAFPDLVLNGHPDDRLPNTLNVSFPPNCPTAYALIQATGHAVAFSAGSACHAGDVCHVSHVLSAMGADKARASRACRFARTLFSSLCLRSIPHSRNFCTPAALLACAPPTHHAVCQLSSPGPWPPHPCVSASRQG